MFANTIMNNSEMNLNCVVFVSGVEFMTRFLIPVPIAGYTVHY